MGSGESHFNVSLFGGGGGQRPSEEKGPPKLNRTEVLPNRNVLPLGKTGLHGIVNQLLSLSPPNYPRLTLYPHHF